MNLDYLKLDKSTRLVPNIGYPIGAPSTPYIYNPLFRRYDLNCVTWPVELAPENLEEYLRAAIAMDLRMLIVTMPHKKAIIPLLDEVDETSRIFNSVNTVRIENGRTSGIGMDGKGALAALRGGGARLQGAEVLMIGAGGITGVIARELALAGVKALRIHNRTVERAESLAAVLREHTSGMAVLTGGMEPAALDAAAAQSTIVLQCTALGMVNNPHDFAYLGFLEQLPRDAVVMEAITNPPYTSFMKKARELGLNSILGVDMLLGQVAEILDYCFGVQPDRAALDECKQVWAQRMGVEV